jgi:flagellar biosynthesis anti-sigma factor FlgM
MTNAISSVSNTPSPAEANTGATVQPAQASSLVANNAANNTTDSAGASESEAVTLSAAAQTTTQLLSSARNAEGFNQTAVDRIRGALQSGTYNVAPEDLAQAIATVLKETN